MREAPVPEQQAQTRSGYPLGGSSEFEPTRPPAGSKVARLIAVILAVAVVLTSVFAAFFVLNTASSPNVWGPSWAETTDSLFPIVPRTNVALLDEEIYLGTLHGVERGGGFYQAQHDMFNMNPGRWNTHSPLTYRQPFLTYLWLVLGSGAAIGIAYGVLAGLSMLVAYRAAETFVRPSVATLAPFALAFVYILGIVHPPGILYAEMWAAPMLVTAGALCALMLNDTERSHPDRLWVLSAVGAASALLAIATRELSVIPVSLMFAALVLDHATRARRLWIPWAAGIVAWIVLYALHVSRVRAVSAGDGAPPLTQAGLIAAYFHPGLKFLSACIRWVSTAPAFVPVVVLLCAAAILGAFTLKGTGVRILVGGTTLGLIVVLVLTGTPGTYSNGLYLGYWGFLFVPVIVGWTPLGLRVLSRFRAL